MDLDKVLNHGSEDASLGSETLQGMEQCNPLNKLPLELRFRIYEFNLTFPSPIKISPILPLPGSKDLPLLRLNREIHREALQVLYERNRISVKYAYFCRNTPRPIKSPIRVDWVRHLLIDGLDHSPICGMSVACNACNKPPVRGLLEVLKSFSQLKTVVVIYHNHKKQMEYMINHLWQSQDPTMYDSRDGTFSRFQGLATPCETYRLVPVDRDPNPDAFKLQGPGLENLSVEFRRGTSGWIDHSVQDQIDWMQKR